MTKLLNSRWLSVLTLVVIVCGANASVAQIFPHVVPSQYNSISQNSVSNLGAFGDTLWVGPLLNYNIGNQSEWNLAEEADSVAFGRGRLYSIALARDTIVAGIGFSDTSRGDAVQTQMGIYISTTGGREWELIDTSRTLDRPDANSILYGGQQISTIPVVVPQQSPPYKVDFKGDVLFFAGWASGIRRSMDFGQTWERVVLPPFSRDVLRPEDDNTFSIDPRGDGTTNEFLNYLGFSVMIASNGRVYAGTAGGLNISENALTAPADSISWRRVRQASSDRGLLGNWITSIRENPYDNAVWLTNWTSISGTDREGLVVTRDNAHTFEHHLVGERIYDVGFQGQTIFAAGRNGVFISADNGNSWIQQRQLRSVNTIMKPSAEYFAVATAGNRVWIGSSDGLASTTDLGASWEITRVNMPLQGGNRYQPDAPSVDAYAYPNPFSAREHDFVRIRFEHAQGGNATIRLFDFAMNPIRTLDRKQGLEPGVYEALWDGTDAHGRTVANGTVFYEIHVEGRRSVGKILVID